MTILVHINGLLQLPGVDYHCTENSISFSSPPPTGSSIDIRGNSGVLARIMGDGSTFLFNFFSDFEHRQSLMLEEAFKLRHIPAVADVLERLQVVVALAKENG